MDTSTKTKNYECSILFMQQEHAHTLKGLHDEISKLQQKCSELTFLGAMNSTYTSQEDVYREKAEGLEKDVKLYKKTVADINKDVELKDKRIKFIEEQMKAQERKYVSELKGKQHIIANMNTELDNKATMISTLTLKIREMKKEARAARESKSGRVRSASKPETISPRDAESYSPAPPMPAPPKDAPPRQRLHRKSLGQVSMSQSTVRNRPPSSRRLAEDRPNSGNSSDSMPDPTPFLRLASSEREPARAMMRSEKTILPPIVSSNDNAVAMPMLLPTSADSDKLFKCSSRHRERVSSSSPEIEVETLAIDQVKGRRHALRQAREYNTSSDC